MKNRADIPENYFESPNLKSKEILGVSNDEYYWYYKSNNSDLWWKYDVNSNNEIENAFNVFNNDPAKSHFKVLIAGKGNTLN